MKNHYLIQNLFLNGIYLIFQGIQLFFNFIFHDFQFLFQPRQLEFHNFSFFQYKGYLWRFSRGIKNFIIFFQVINDNNYMRFSFYSSFFYFLNHPIRISQSIVMQIPTKCTFANPSLKIVLLADLPPYVKMKFRPL